MTRCPHRRRDPKVAAHLLVPQGPARIFNSKQAARGGVPKGMALGRSPQAGRLGGTRWEGGGLRTQAASRGPRRRVDTAVSGSARGAPGRDEEGVVVHPRRGIPAPGGNRRPPGRGLADERRGLPQSGGHPLRDAKRTRAGASGAGTSRGSGDGARRRARPAEGVSCEDTGSDLGECGVCWRVSPVKTPLRPRKSGV